MTEKRKASALSAAFLSSLPVMAGYLVLGIAFGVLMERKGFGAGMSIAMSALIYAGSMQFAGIGLLTGGASLLTVAMTTLAVNARHILYGVSMAEEYRDSGAAKPYLIFALTDETYSLAVRGAPEGVPKYRYYLFVTLFDHLYWMAGTVLGAWLGSVLPIAADGLDFALTALFVTVLMDSSRASSSVLPTLIGLGAPTVCLLIFGADAFLIPSMVVIVLLLLLGQKKLGGAAV